GFYVRSLFGLWLGMMGLAIAYDIIPRLVGRPLYSRGLAAFGFWAMAALYPATGSHLLAEPAPAWLQRAAVVLGLLLAVSMWAVLFNLFRTAEGRWGRLVSTVPGRFAAVGLIFYFLFWLVGLVELLPGAQVVDFTYWVVARDQLALFGAFSFMAFAGIYDWLPRRMERPWLSGSLGGVHFWLSTIGAGGLVLALLRAGLAQGWVGS